MTTPLTEGRIPIPTLTRIKLLPIEVITPSITSPSLTKKQDKIQLMRYFLSPVSIACKKLVQDHQIIVIKCKKDRCQKAIQSETLIISAQLQNAKNFGKKQSKSKRKKKSFIFWRTRSKRNVLHFIRRRQDKKRRLGFRQKAKKKFFKK